MEIKLQAIDDLIHEQEKNLKHLEAQRNGVEKRIQLEMELLERLKKKRLKLTKT